MSSSSEPSLANPKRTRIASFCAIETGVSAPAANVADVWEPSSFRQR